jgi:hypothetical protein
MKRREVAAARGPSNPGPRSPPQTPLAQHPAQRPDRAGPARSFRSSVNYLTLGGRKIWEPYLAKLNADAEGDANAHRNNRYRRRGRDWPDLVGRSDVRVGTRGQRGHRHSEPSALGTRTQNAPAAGGQHCGKDCAPLLPDGGHWSARRMVARAPSLPPRRAS